MSASSAIRRGRTAGTLVLMMFLMMLGSSCGKSEDNKAAVSYSRASFRDVPELAGASDVVFRGTLESFKGTSADASIDGVDPDEWGLEYANYTVEITEVLGLNSVLPSLESTYKIGRVVPISFYVSKAVEPGSTSYSVVSSDDDDFPKRDQIPKVGSEIVVFLATGDEGSTVSHTSVMGLARVVNGSVVFDEAFNRDISPRTSLLRDVGAVVEQHVGEIRQSNTEFREDRKTRPHSTLNLGSQVAPTTVRD